MKQTIKHYLQFSLFLFSISFCLIGCQKDDDLKPNESPLAKNNSRFTITNVGTNKILENKSLNTKLEKLEKDISKRKEVNANKLIYSSQYDFFINTDYAKYIKSADGAYHSYTFPILRVQETDILENLLISLQPDGSYKTMIVTYNTTAEEKENIQNGINVNLFNKITVSAFDDYDFFDDVFSKESASSGCIAVSYEPCSNGGNADGHPPVSIGNGAMCSGSSYVIDVSTCDMSGGGGTGFNSGSGDSSSPYSGDNNTTYTDGNTNNSGSYGGSTYNDTTTPTPYVCNTCPEIEDDECFMSDEDLNASYSANSPFTVDLSSVRASCDSIATPENDKLMCIYNKLVASPSFKNLFIDTFGESADLNIKFEITNEDMGGAQGRTSATITTTGGVSEIGLITIKINQSSFHNSGLNARTPILIARTILHESIHAFLIVKRYNSDLGTDLDHLNNQLLGELLNEFHDGSCLVDEEQHEFMYAHLLPTMEIILAQIKDGMISTAEQEYLQSSNYYQENTPSNPLTESHPFNWTEFFHFVSIQGLHQSQSVIDYLASDTSTNFLYNNYNYDANQISKNCN